MSRFKIDVTDSIFRPFGLYIKNKHWHRLSLFSQEWIPLNSFEVQHEARDFYEKIKDLPEYLP